MAGTNTRSDANQSFFVYVKDANTGVVKRIAIPGDVQIGLEGQPSELQLLGRLSIAGTNYNIDNVNKGTISVSNDDTIVALNLITTPLTGRIRISLPGTPRDGQLHFIKDMTGTAATVPIDIYPVSGRTIDGQTYKTLSDAYGSLALVWLNGQWRILVAGLGASGGSGAGSNASYVTINSESGLTSERHLTGSITSPYNIRMTDQGSKGKVFFDLSQILGAGAGTFTYATVTADAYGRITAISNGSTPPSANAGYLTIGNEPTLPNHRQMSGGLGTTVTDNGIGTTFEFNVDPRVVPFLTGATFSGPIIAAGGLSGSLQRLSNGDSYLIGASGISIVSNSSGQIVINGSGIAGVQPWIDTGLNKIYVTSSVEVTGTLRTTGGVVASGGLSGSLQKLTDGITAAITAIGGITITTSSNGQLIFSGSGAGGVSSANLGSFASSEFVLLALTASVPNGRLLSQGTGINIIDSGPFNLISIGINNNVVATVSGTTFTGAVIASGVGTGKGLSGSLQLLSDGHTPYIVGQGAVIVTTSSSGQVIVSASFTNASSITTQPWTDNGVDSLYTTSSVSIDASSRTASQIGSDVYFFVSGTLGKGPGASGRKVADFGGDIYVSGTIISSGGLSGSLQLLADGITPYIVGVGGVTITTSSKGQILVSSSRGASGATVGVNIENQTAGLPSSPYSTLDFSGSILRAIDNGGVAQIVAYIPWIDTGTTIRTTSSVSISGLPEIASVSMKGTDVFFYVSGTIGLSGSKKSLFGGDVIVSGSVIANSISGSLQRLANGSQYIIGSGQATTVTNSLGQVIVQVPVQWVDQNNRIYTTSSVLISSTATIDIDTLGTDVYFYVSGSKGLDGGPSQSKSVFGGDVIISGSLTVFGNGVSGSGITGSLTQLPNNLGAYIVGIGGTHITTNSVGQIIVSSSIGGSGGSGGTPGVTVQNQGATLPTPPYAIINFTGAGVSTSDIGGIATVDIPGGQPGLVPGAFAVYNGYTTSSVWWNSTNSWTPFTSSMIDDSFFDTSVVNLSRNGSAFTFRQSGFYQFHAGFNAIGNNAYISLRLSGTNGAILQRSTYRSTTTDQNPIVLDGVIHINSGDIYTLEYATLGTTHAWTGSNPMPGGDNMRSGEIDIFLIPSGSATVNNYSITASVGSVAYAPANWATGSQTYSMYSAIAGSGFTNVPGVAGTITTTGSPVLIMVQSSWVAQTAGAQTSFDITRNGTKIAGDATYGMTTVGPRAQSYNQPANIVYIDYPPVGTYTYQYRANGLAGTGILGAYGVTPATMMLFEMKNANVVTSSTNASTTVGASYAPIIGLSCSIVPGKNPVMLIASVNPTFANSGDWTYNSIFRTSTSTNLAAAGNGLQAFQCGGSNEAMNGIMFCLDTSPTYGATNSYAVEAGIGGGSAPQYGKNGQIQTLIAWELTDVNYRYVSTTNATTIPSGFGDLIGTTPPPVLSTRGRPVMLMSNANFNPTATSGRAAYTLARNNTPLTSASKGFQLLDGEGVNSYNSVASTFWLDAVPSPGSYTYTVQGNIISGSGQIGESSVVTSLFMYELDAGGPGVIIGGWFDEGGLLFTTASIQVLGNENLGGSLTVGGSLSVGGSTTITGSLNVTGSEVINGDLRINGILTYASSSNMAITGSSVSRTFHYPLLMGMVTSPQYSGSKSSLGTNYYNPTKLNKGIDSVRFFFRSTFAPVLSAGNAYVDLYDYNGIVTGIPAPIAGSVLTASSPSTLTMQQTELTSLFNAVTGSGIIMARAWCDPSGSNFVNVGATELVAEWN